MLCHRMSFRFPSFLISSTRKMSSITPTEKAFMAAPHFAVVGASKDTSKFGTRVCTSSPKARGLLISPNDQVLKWYQARTYDVVPVHPVTVYPVLYLASYLIFPRRKRKNSKAWPQSAQLLSSRRPRRRASTSLHRPRYVYQIHISTKSLRIWRQVTLSILEKAKELSVPTLWLQPGAEDETVIEYIKANDLSDRVIYGGPCILVIGDDIAKSNIDSAL